MTNRARGRAVSESELLPTAAELRLKAFRGTGNALTWPRHEAKSHSQPREPYSAPTFPLQPTTGESERVSGL